MKYVRLNKNCKKCGSNNGILNKNGPHTKLSCNHCGSYIKFVSKNEYNKLIEDNGMEDNGMEGNDIDEINFKLDLILDHLGIIKAE